MVSVEYLLKNNKKVLFTLLLSTLGVILLAMLEKSQVQRLVTERHTLKLLRQDYQNLQTIYSDNLERGPDLARVLGSTPSSYDEIRDYAGKIEKLARESNLSSLEIKFDSESKKESAGGKSLKINIRVDGSYPNLSNFLAKVANLPYNTKYETVNFGDSETGLINLNLVYKLYVND